VVRRRDSTALILYGSALIIGIPFVGW
jgi:hypothetical protein